MDALLAARPEDRRAIFLERPLELPSTSPQTGGQRYRILAALTRVDDILGELEPQRQPLLEKRRGERYLDIEQRRRAVERDLLYELNMADRRRQRDQRQMEQLKEQSRRCRTGCRRWKPMRNSWWLRALAVQDDLISLTSS